MTLLAVPCALCTAVAVALLVRPPGARALSRLLPADPPGARRSRRQHRPVVAALIAGLAVAAGGIVAGPPGVVVAAAAIVAGFTAARLVRLHTAGRRAAAARAEVAHACRVLAGQLRVGRIPAEALRIAAEDCPVLAPAASALDLGSDPVRQWRTDAARPGRSGLLVLARAWRVSVETGAPLAPALERVSEALSEDLAVELLVVGEVSAARATAKVMAALPLCGIAIGYLIGGRPVQFLVAGPLGWTCLLGGVLLAGAGAIWIDWLSRSVVDGEAVR